MKGSYVLVLRSETAVEVEVGRLGLLRFAPGSYAYCGSALSGLESRISRHLRTSKAVHWHIDYLTALIPVVDVWTFPGGERRECLLNRLLLSVPGASLGAPGFGSSDCRCPGHLVRLPDDTELLMTEAFLHARLVDAV